MRSTASSLPFQVQDLSQALVSEDGAGIQRLGRQIDLKAHPFAALNTAFLEDGAVIHLPANESISQPIHVAFVSVASDQPRVSHPRVLVVAESGSRASVIVDHVSMGDAERFTNSVIEVFAEANSNLDLVLLQRGADTDYQVSNLSDRVPVSCRTFGDSGSCPGLCSWPAWILNVSTRGNVCSGRNNSWQNHRLFSHHHQFPTDHHLRRRRAWIPRKYRKRPK